MATIVARKGASGPSFQARVRLTRDGELIHKEFQTFLTKAAAKDWAQRREIELKDPKPLAIAISGGTCTLATLFAGTSTRSRRSPLGNAQSSLPLSSWKGIRPGNMIP